MIVPQVEQSVLGLLLEAARQMRVVLILFAGEASMMLWVCFTSVIRN